MLIFTRNAAGELVSEENHGGKFEYGYDALGNLSSTRFPDGRELASLRYGTGHLLEMQLRHGGATHTLAAYGRDRLHREISRSQGVLSQETHYDTQGVSRSARCWTPAASSCLNAATAGTAPTR
ncbi:RHS repeat protein [Cronobacter dublinensis]|nr:RHS repeat protein [Cronobacter dublinensis]ELY3774449.1 RHS repeat protein [Cronobacter dublinensis]